jgi:hypothetical protein
MDEITFNPFTNRYDFIGEAHTFKGVRAVAPAGPKEGWTYVNSGDDTYYIYYGGAWQALHVLTPAIVYALELEGSTDLVELEGSTDCVGIQ